MEYITRPLGKTILNTASGVIVIEGARAVGKTMLMQKELEPQGFSYYSLADDSTYQQAKNDISAWVNSLPRPTIIDEAQRIESLPLAIKEAADKADSAVPQFVLTGSATLNRKGLGGQNPLTRRACNFELHPFTQREIKRAGASIIDIFWDAQPNMEFQSTITERQLQNLLSVGGFPRYALSQHVMTSADRSRLIRSDIENTLGDTLLPGEKIDASIANAILSSLFALPGNILNVSRMASELERDGRTIERYIDIFERRFLIRRLPNLALQAHKQTQSRPKIHPIDSSFSVEEFRRAGKDVFGEDRTLLGSVLESYVVCQIAPEAQWSKRNTDLFYWRQPGKNPKEVDLVLQRDSQLIGVEVKASGALRPKDFDGLDALADDNRFYRGFLIYTGSRIVRHRENIWAIPVDALWETSAFSKIQTSNDQAFYVPITTNISTQQQKGHSMSTADASLFLSYNHADNDYLEGEITKLIDEIANSYEFLYGNKLDVFIDSRSIQWGQQWEQELDSRIESCNVIMPAVTPRYLRSEACRKELFAFKSKVDARPNNRIMSLIWQDYSTLKDSGDMAANIIGSFQYENVEDLRGIDSRSAVYRKRAEALARRIHEAISDNNENVIKNDSTTRQSSNTTQEMGLAEQLSSCEQIMPIFTEAFTKVSNDTMRLLNICSEHPAPRNGKADDLLKWTLAIDTYTKNDVSILRKNINEAKTAWTTMLDCLSGYVNFTVSLADTPQGKQQVEAAYNMVVSLKNTSTIPEETQSIMPLVKSLGLISPRLKPLGDSFVSVVELMNDIKASIDQLESTLLEVMVV